MKKSMKSLASPTARTLDTSALTKITGGVSAPRDACSGFSTGITPPVDAHSGQIILVDASSGVSRG